ncbi:DUF4176 domain-containing protein [Bacillus sp. CGMCC 1.16541]|uniref:DUF4176 domain-containing protein n=1 Tax=Bacillus sp. CGMCC 1.16541 TaxID=2185143 RepID=UPI000D728D80|nr:DUF4176 domain-containing protein [Bacillus sp. CGMCC 1.16541]
MSDLKNECMLPIGTVVKLKDVRKLVMIYGRFQKQASTGTIFDYVSVPYPEGNITDEYNLFFNRNMIESIEHMGMQSSVEDEMREKVEEDLKHYKK